MRINDFEEISSLEPNEIKAILKTVAPEVIVKAYMGTSPENATWLKKVIDNIDFEAEKAEIGRIAIKELEDAQKEIVNAINEVS